MISFSVERIFVRDKRSTHTLLGWAVTSASSAAHDLNHRAGLETRYDILDSGRAYLRPFVGVCNAFVHGSSARAAAVVPDWTG